MLTTAYDFLLWVLGLPFVNHTSHKISKRFSSRSETPVEELASPPMSHYVSRLSDDGLDSSENHGIPFDNMSIESKSDSIPELHLPPPAISLNQSLLTPRTGCKLKYFKTAFYYILNVLYICFILATICWKPVYKFMTISKYPHWMANAFMYIIPIQYFVELNYFRTSHFYKTLSTNPAYTNVVNYYSLIVLLASLCASLVSVFLYIFTDYIDMYEQIKQNASTNKLILFGFICAFEHFYSYCIFFCCIFTFSTVFTVHNIAINKFAEFVGGMKYDSTSVNFIHEKYMSHKEAYEKSVDHLNTMFATTTLLGALASFGVFVHIPMGLFVMDIFDILYIILYIIGEIVYFYSINRVRKSITHIQTTIFSGNFIKRYLSRQPFQESSLDIHPSMKSLKDMDAESDIGSISYSINRMSKHVACISTNISDTMTSTDWLIMSKLMDIPWKNFTLVGFQVENIGFINRIGAVIFGLLMASGFLSMMDLHLGSK